MDTPILPELSPEERKAARKAYMEAWRAAHPGYAARKGREWREQNPERSVAYDKAYKIANHERMLEKQRAYNERHAARKRAYTNAWRAAHVERARASNREWREKNPARRHEYAVAYRAEHLEESNARFKAWAQANPEKVRFNQNKRRARIAGAPINDFTDEQWEALCKAARYRCCYCGEKGTAETLEPDHLTPYAKNGSNTLHNVLPCCSSCNSRKKDRAVLKPVQPFLLLPDDAD